MFCKKTNNIASSENVKKDVESCGYQNYQICHRILVYILVQVIKISTEENLYVGSFERCVPFILSDNFSF